MSTKIENTATLTFNGNTLPPTCPVITKVEPNLKPQKYATTENGRFDSEGTIGKSRKVTYDILLVNYSSTDFTNVVVKDTIKLPEGVSADGMVYIAGESKVENQATLPNIELNVGTLPKESQMVVYYTIQFPDTIPVGTVIENIANVDYTENTNKTEQGATIPIDTNEVKLTISYSDTTVTSEKTGPSEVLCGQDFDYVLKFANTGENTATGVQIQDDYETGFVINSVKVVLIEIDAPEGEEGDELIRGTDYEYTDNANPLVITSIDNGLDIPSGYQLVVTVNGKYECA